ncbi:MAG: molybdopterin-dependent oxidoreductase [Acidimicrobiia bacterium]|nr:molybdopterin-dependent oxidoreductase [Acidimicrobiia bacterium]
MEWTHRRFAGLSGIIAAGVALGVGELLAGLSGPVPSPLFAIGGVVIDLVPSGVERWAISLFGTADKAALAIGTVVIALVAGWFTGIAALRRFWIAVVVLVSFAGAGMAAGWSEPGARAVPLVAATLVAVAASLSLLWIMLRAIDTAAAADPSDTTGADSGRRRFLVIAGVGGAVAVGTGAIGRALLASVPPPPSVDIGTAVNAVTVGPEHDFMVPGLSPAVVPSEDFYRIDTALAIPRIAPEDWSIRVHGRVDREVVITYDDLTAADLIERYVTLSCVSNKVGGSLVGNALWTGIPLAGILEEAGADRSGTQVVGRSIDGWTCGFPTDVAFDGRDALIAVGMNGDVLPRVHGFPARLVVPGLYGYVSATKWLTEIEITGWNDFDPYWIPRGWAKEAPIKTQSRVDVPRNRSSVEGPAVVAAGVAWAPGRGIAAVEVRLDDGPWQATELSEPLSGDAWVQWRITLEAGPGEHRLSVRATDGDGIVQTDMLRSVAPDGATGHHSITFTGI